VGANQTWRSGGFPASAMPKLQARPQGECHHCELGSRLYLRSDAPVDIGGKREAMLSNDPPRKRAPAWRGSAPFVYHSRKGSFRASSGSRDPDPEGQCLSNRQRGNSPREGERKASTERSIRSAVCSPA
jgi:hypothetical protein